MSKLANKAKSSKLKESTFNSQEKNNIINKKNFKEYPRSYRLDFEVMNILKSTLDRVNEVSPKKVSEARLIKALITLSRTLDDEKIIKALREVW